MKGLIRTSLFVLCFIGSKSLLAQCTLENVDLKKIRQKKVRKMLDHQKMNQIKYFDDLETSVLDTTNLKGFMNFEKVFTFKKSSDLVWDNYRYSSQTDVWDLNKISFAFLFDKNSSSLVYANQDWYGLKKGQIFYLNLKILNGFYSIPVAFEIVKVDPEQKIIEFSYLKGGKAAGIQMIHIEQDDDGNTQITHKSFVKSSSKIRDKFLYPFFHNKLINEFHSNMRRMINRYDKSSAVNLAEISR